MTPPPAWKTSLFCWSPRSTTNPSLPDSAVGQSYAAAGADASAESAAAANHPQTGRDDGDDRIASDEHAESATTPTSKITLRRCIDAAS
jgi:hypothetical protein